MPETSRLVPIPDLQQKLILAKRDCPSSHSLSPPHPTEPIQQDSVGAAGWGMAVVSSISRSQDRLHLRMHEHVLPEPVILIEANIGEGVRTGERQIAVGVQTRSDAQRIGR